MAATELKLGLLHEKVADVLMDALDGEEIPGYTDYTDEGEVREVIPAKRMSPSAAIIAAATKFLKDNEITCAPAQNNALDRLEEKAKALREKRSMTTTDSQDAKRTAGFMLGSC
jgi:hypothetical protein